MDFQIYPLPGILYSLLIIVLTSTGTVVSSNVCLTLYFGFLAGQYFATKKVLYMNVGSYSF